MPMHWTDALAPSGRANAATSGPVDPVSGQPEFKHTPARIYGYRETWSGFCISRDALPAPKDAAIVWRRIPQTHCQLHEFAGRGDDSERDFVHRALTRGASGECLRYEDGATASLREAYVIDGRLQRVVFRGPRLPPRDWLVAAFAEDMISDDVRRWLLHGRAPDAKQDTSAIVCACAGVSVRVIGAAINAGATSVEAIGEATRGGATCGSCRPEIRRLLAEATQEEKRDAA
jgi:assimilatory nitrate reductase catalytic subunit